MPKSSSGDGFSGEVVLPAPPPQVWRLLTDPAVAAACLPNVRNWRPGDAPGMYEAEMAFKWGDRELMLPTAVSWLLDDEALQAKMRLAAQRPEIGFTAHTDMHLRLLFGRHTELFWSAEFELFGKLAEMPYSAVKMVTFLAVNRFFKNVKARLK